MSEQEIQELELWIHKNVFQGDKFVGLRRRGLWYRPNAGGYTDRQEEAGRYTREEAKKHAYPYDEPVTIHEFDVPKYASDPAASFRVLERCVEKNCDLGIEVDANGFHCGRIYWSDLLISDGEYAKTLGLTICYFAKQLFTKT